MSGGFGRVAGMLDNARSVGRSRLLDDELRTPVVAVFRRHGVEAPVYLAREVDPTEAVFVVGPVATPPQEALAIDLTALLGRKVWVTKLTPTWEDVGLERLDV